MESRFRSLALITYDFGPPYVELNLAVSVFVDNPFMQQLSTDRRELAVKDDRSVSFNKTKANEWSFLL